MAQFLPPCCPSRKGKALGVSQTIPLAPSDPSGRPEDCEPTIAVTGKSDRVTYAGNVPKGTPPTPETVPFGQEHQGTKLIHSYQFHVQSLASENGSSGDHLIEDEEPANQQQS